MTLAGATCWPRTKPPQTPACQRCAARRTRRASYTRRRALHHFSHHILWRACKPKLCGCLPKRNDARLAAACIREGDGLRVYLLTCRVVRCATLSVSCDGARVGGHKRWRRLLGQASWSMPHSQTSAISVPWEKKRCDTMAMPPHIAVQ